MGERLSYAEVAKSNTAAQNFRVSSYRDNNSRGKYRKRVIVVTDDDEIINDNFQVTVSVEGDYQNVMIYWEESGYSNYHDYGLYGFYSTKYYRMKYEEGKLVVYGDRYTITVVE